MMLRLRFTLDGEDQIVPLTDSEIRVGRSGENELVLPDYSVSRRHAVLRPGHTGWTVEDLQSTNGVQLNQHDIERTAVFGAHDILKIGVFELWVEVEPAPGESAPVLASSPAAPPVPSPPQESARAGDESPSRESVLSNATIVRSLEEFNADYGLEDAEDDVPPGETERTRSEARATKRKALDEAYGTEILTFLTPLARTLINAETLDIVLERVMDVAFSMLPVDRGFILLSDEASGEPVCELVRTHDRVELRPEGEAPISRTMVETVIRERVALLTYDALADHRLAGTESVRIHQIRAAMCAPLWSAQKIIGVIQVDTPQHGSFTEQDVDLLTILANFCAVAIERIRAARRADNERQLRSRLERYHSPGVIESIVDAEGGQRRLERIEATVLFADIVGFTAFSENADPEEVAELMEAYFTHAVEAIFGTGGTLDKFIGDCVMAFFGAPMPQEDHAERAVSAAIHIQNKLDDWNAERTSSGLPEVRVRIGINSGAVVVGDIGSNRRVDYTVLGNTVNVAARLEESVAQSGEIVIGEATRRLLGDRFATESLGDVSLKGLSQRIGAHRVLRGDAAEKTDHGI